MKHTLLALVQDHPGTLNRAVSLFRRRRYNIDSIAVGRSEAEGLSRMTLVVEADDVEQVVKQLDRLVEVLRVQDVTHASTLERETALLKLRVTRQQRQEVVALCSVFGGRVLDVGSNGMVLELTGRPADLDQFIDLVRPLGLEELSRTGRVAMVRASRVPDSTNGD
ncbi:MAG: acetolactate synthase small subunit [Longimicrobiales bacterium]